MGAAPATKLSAEEYLTLDEAAEVKSEFYDGELLPVINDSLEHSTVALNTAILMRFALAETPCTVYLPNRVRVRSAKYVYPDLVVVCGAPKFSDKSQTLTNPKVIVEILSPSTGDYDRGAKARLYMGVDSIDEYMMIYQDQPRVEILRRTPRATWERFTFTDPNEPIPLESIGATLTIAEIHKGVTYPDEPLP